MTATARTLQVAVRGNFMYGHHHDIEIVAERMGLDSAGRRYGIRHNINGWWLTDAQAKDAKYAGATPVSQIEEDFFFHPEDFR